jgi:hypothetical protein
VTKAEAATNMLAPVATETEAAIDALGPVAAEATIETQAGELSSGLEAEIAHAPKADAADPPLTAPVILSADEDPTRSLLYIASVAVTGGDVSVHETQAIAEPTDDVAVPAESPAAAALHPQEEPPQDYINVAAEMPEDKDEAASTALTDEAASMAPTVEAASAAPVVETASASSAIEVAVSVARDGQELAQVESSASVGESVTVGATKPHRPANDPFAALYGLSEEELIALFS